MIRSKYMAILLILLEAVVIDEATDQNVLGSELQLCGKMPATGFYMRGYCTFFSSHPKPEVVCAEMNQDFLDFSKSTGNDLSTSKFGFSGLKPGDHWCLNVFLWRKAYLNGHPPLVVLQATHSQALVYLNATYPPLSLDDLSKYST